MGTNFAEPMNNIIHQQTFCLMWWKLGRYTFLDSLTYLYMNDECDVQMEENFD